MRGRDLFFKFEILIKVSCFLFSLMPLFVRYFLFGFFKYFPGKLGVFFRFCISKNLFLEVGDNVAIFEAVYIKSFNRISIGDNVSIHPMTYIEGAGKLEIGSNVSIAHSVSILTTEHSFKDRLKPIKDQGCIEKRTCIQDDVWIGCGVRVLAGSTIGKGSVIAAGSVVKGNLEAYSVYAGVPARKIKER